MLIFLDIDGVMVPANAWKRPEILADAFPMFNARATSALNRILDETKADIILTTSHKSNFSLDEWRKIFNLRGIYLNKLERLPDNKQHLGRKEELTLWFSDNGVIDNFIIIDDDKSLNDLPFYFKNRLILTSGSVGLTNDLASEAILLLKGRSTPMVA